MEWLLKPILNPLEHLSILCKIRWSTHRILRAFQRRFTLNPKRFNINHHSNAFQKPSNLFYFGNIWKILKIRQNRSYNYHIITYLHRQNWQTMFFSYFYKDRMDIVDRCYREMSRYRNLTSYFTNKNISVSYLRAKKKADTQRVINLYGKGAERYW